MVDVIACGRALHVHGLWLQIRILRKEKKLTKCGWWTQLHADCHGSTGSPSALIGGSKRGVTVLEGAGISS